MRPLQSLTLEATIQMFSSTFGHICDTRHVERVNYRLHDTLMRGFAMMFFQPPSLLELQRKMQQRRSRCNLETIFGVHEVPADTQMREILDGVPGESLRQVLPEICAKVRRVGWATDFKSTVPSGFHQGDYSTAMLDGSDDFHSTTLECPGCLQRTDTSGAIHCRHTVVSATLVKAGSHRVWPLDVEEVRHSDGQDKQDGEVNAAKRLLPRLRQEHPQLPLIIGGDALYGHEPCIAQVRDLGLHHILVCKPSAHTELYEWVDDIERLGGCEKGQWFEGPACRRRFFTYRVVRAVPLTAARRVWGTLVEVWEHARQGTQLYHHAWFTDLEVRPDNVTAIVGIGRSRWKIGVSSEGHSVQSVEVRPRLKDSGLVAWEAPWRENKTVEPSDNMRRKAHAQHTRLQRAVNAAVASSHAIPVAETVDNARRQQGLSARSPIRQLSPAGYQRRHGVKETVSTGEALGVRRSNLAEEAVPITVRGKWRRRHQGGGSGRSTVDGRAAQRARREGPGPVSTPFVQVRQG